MEFKAKRKPEFLNIKIDKDGFESEASMELDSIAFVVGHLLEVLEEQGYGNQEDLAVTIVATNRAQEKDK